MTFVPDMQWVDTHYEELQRKYPGKFIVVRDGRVIAVGDNYREAEQRALEKLGPDVEIMVERIEIGELFAYTSLFQPANGNE